MTDLAALEVQPPPRLSTLTDEDRAGRPARILDGRPLAAEIGQRVRRQAAAFARRYGFSPVLAAVIVGRERASSVYVEQILRSCRTVGVPSRVVELPRTAGAAELRRAVETLNADAEVARETVGLF